MDQSGLAEPVFAEFQAEVMGIPVPQNGSILPDVGSLRK